MRSPGCGSASDWKVMPLAGVPLWLPIVPLLQAAFVSQSFQIHTNI
uniref:Uncharacterized protein n=1 Tax=Rhizophora mucronata TaxID=61149 RepID=A0A2P2QNP5_RHIMU